MADTVKYVFYIITGIIALALAVIVFLSRKHHKILGHKTILDLFWTINFLLTPSGAGIAGVVQNAVSVTRDSVCVLKERKINLFIYRWWMYIFMGLFIIVPVLSWSPLTDKLNALYGWENAGWISLIPCIGSEFSVISLFAKTTKVTKGFSIPCNSLCLIYSIICQNIFGIIGYSFMIISAIVGLIREPKKLEEENSKINTCENSEI